MSSAVCVTQRISLAVIRKPHAPAERISRDEVNKRMLCTIGNMRMPRFNHVTLLSDAEILHLCVSKK